MRIRLGELRPILDAIGYSAAAKEARISLGEVAREARIFASSTAREAHASRPGALIDSGGLIASGAQRRLRGAAAP